VLSKRLNSNRKDKMLLKILVSILIFFVVAHFAPLKMFCKLGFHKAPKKVTFDGCSYEGECSVCNKGVLQDSQGNWF
jgi:hypothetical protein